MNGVTFGQPEYFLGLLLLIPLLILRVRAHFQRGKNLPGLVSAKLEKQLVVNSGKATSWLVFSMHCLALASVITALARPQLGFDEIETQTEGRNLIVAIDTSRSMLADDLRPSRLVRAKLAARDIIVALPEDRIGLLAFAGRPFIQAPLTVDHEAVIESIDQLDTEIIPRGGTNIAAAAEMALETFAEAEVEQSALVIFSDGEALEGGEEIEKVREKARESGMTILAVGVGTLEGAIIPENDAKGQPIPGRFVMDSNGQVVKSRLEPSALQELASLGGTYIHLGGQASLTQVVKQIREGITTSREESEMRLRPIERFMWPLGASILFFVLGYLIPLMAGRPRNSAFPARAQAAVIGILFGSTSVVAIEGFESGYKAFEAGDYESALELYEGALAEKITDKDRTRLQMGVGATAYKLKDFERAAAAYGEALTYKGKGLREQAHYNLGNTLYQRGEAALQAIGKPVNPDQPQNLSGSSESLDTTIQQWESAIEHFESTLSLNQANERATHNMEVVKKKLEELKEQQKEQEEQEQQEEEQEEEEEQKDEEDKEEDEEEDKEDEQEKDQEDEGEDKEEPSEGEEEEDPEGKPEDQEGDGEPEDQPPGDEEGKPEDKEGEDPQNEGEEDKEDGKEDDKEQDGEGDQGENEKSDSPPGSPEGGEPEEPDAPEDGDLEADPNQEQPPANPQNPAPTNPAEMKTNPETGYSPSEARQLLDTLADETEVRPILLPSRNEVYKNW